MQSDGLETIKKNRTWKQILIPTLLIWGTFQLIALLVSLF